MSGSLRDVYNSYIGLISESVNLDTNFSDISLNDHQKQALVFVKEVGAIDNATYRQLSGADILKSSTDLRALRDANLLTANGKSRMTYYTPGPSILTMQDKEQGLQDKEHNIEDKEEHQRYAKSDPLQ